MVPTPPSFSRPLPNAYSPKTALQSLAHSELDEDFDSAQEHQSNAADGGDHIRLTIPDPVLFKDEASSTPQNQSLPQAQTQTTPSNQTGPRFRHNRGRSQLSPTTTTTQKGDVPSYYEHTNSLITSTESSGSLSSENGPVSPIAKGNSSSTDFGRGQNNRIAMIGGKGSLDYGKPSNLNLLINSQSDSQFSDATEINSTELGSPSKEKNPPIFRGFGTDSPYLNSPSSTHNNHYSSNGLNTATSSVTILGNGSSYPAPGPGSNSNPNSYAGDESTFGYSTFTSPFSGSKYGNLNQLTEFSDSTTSLGGSGSGNGKTTLVTSNNGLKGKLGIRSKNEFEILLSQAGDSPFSWDTMDGKEEADDFLHQDSDSESIFEKPSSSSNSKRKTKSKSPCSLISNKRAILNIGSLILLAAAMLTLFMGYPIIDGTRYLASSSVSNNQNAANAAINSGPLHVGNINDYNRFPNLIDVDTPDDVKEKLSVDGSTKMKLVFSDEFNQDGRSFYPGDDPFWEAVDLWYWGTQNYEWYDPAAVTTQDGALQITLSEMDIHDLNFRGGMLQSWNKFCFTGGLVEARIRLPGYSNVPGLWPAFWIMGNLGRPGYGASLEGLWPYSYETCDVGTVWNQTTPDGIEGIPASNARGGRTAFNGKYNTQSLSFLQGQRLSACTCETEDHPGPKLSDGSWKGRSAPEIDVLEAQVGRGVQDPSTRVMQISSSAQFAPFNNDYTFTNRTGPAYTVFTPLQSKENTYKGAAFQQSGSIVSDTLVGTTEKGIYGQGGGGAFATYGTEYTTGTEGTATWIQNDQPNFRLNAAALESDLVSQIGSRVMAAEPMSIILNLGISQNFGTPDWTRLAFPSTMSVDWVRVYQPEDSINIGCDPDDYPTADYINRHPEAYNNPKLQFWGRSSEEGGLGMDWPRSNLTGCDSEPSKGGIENPANPHLIAPYISAADLPGFQ